MVSPSWTLSLSPPRSPALKHPEPAPRRANTVNKKQSPLTSPILQHPPVLLEEGAPPQLEPQTQAAAPEVEQPGLSGGGSGGGALGGGVQVATVHPQVVTQLSAEESR